MPFKSKAQRKFMYSKHPDIAKKWSEAYLEEEKLPAKVKKKKKSGMLGSKETD